MINREHISSIYHEKQIAALCGIHAINNLVQQPAFSTDILVSIAQDLDQQEKMLLGSSSPNGESQNISDSGDFSVQVLQRALENFGLRLTNLNKPEMEAARAAPTTACRGYLCNHDSHWLAVRRFANAWFNLDSGLMLPEYVSPTYLGLFLEQLRYQGYTIYVVDGDWPFSEADIFFGSVPFDSKGALDEQKLKQLLQPQKQARRTLQQEDDEAMEQALALSIAASMGDKPRDPVATAPVEDDPDLQTALLLSMQS
eukprot:TRINITY_DN1212_c0_g3_i1.p1 TRINITY_DN1212_c0_g3~~TRINITY_DN1212_c0_g3_i1.p1  ORF type:complete len:264 (-),score=47.43 TRINITY_DN1212_c0_g3_i1:254-1021(-)